MMNDRTYIRDYVNLRDDNVNETITIFCEDVGTRPCIEFRCGKLFDSTTFIQMLAFDDSWVLFPHVQDLFRMLALGGENIQADELVNILETLGFEDVTP